MEPVSLHELKQKLLATLAFLTIRDVTLAVITVLTHSFVLRISVMCLVTSRTEVANLWHSMTPLASITSISS
jgi:hypothetical protein